MATNPTFSGFLTNFITTNGGSGDFTDILSDLASGAQQTIFFGPGQSAGVNINWKYFYLGNLLIQFTSGINNANLNTGNYFLNYGINYSTATPYFILLTAVDTNTGGTGSVTLNSLNASTFYFSTTGGVSLTALVIGPK